MCMTLTVDEALRKGVIAHQAGELQEADRYYTAVLHAQPKHPDANHNMGILAVGVGKAEEALTFFKMALEINPNIDQFWISYISTLLDVGRFDDARVSLALVRNNGARGDAFDQLEQRMKQIGSNNMPAVSQDPPQDQLLDLQDLFDQTKFQQGLVLVNQLLDKYPTSAVLSNFRGIALEKTGSFDAAIECFQGALKLIANSEFSNDSSRDLEVALLSNLGHVYRGIMNISDALECYKRGLVLKPNSSGIHNDKGNLELLMGDLEAAQRSYLQAVALDPEFSLAHLNMGKALELNQKFESALESYTRVLKIQPSDPEALAQVLLLRGYLCLWSDRSEDNFRVSSLGMSSGTVSAFSMLTLEDSPCRHQLRAALFAKASYTYPSLPLASKPVEKNRRLRIGYFSIDFQDHPVAHLLVRVLELHNRGDFEIFAYSYGQAADTNASNLMRTRIVSAVDHFRDIHALRDLDVAEMVREDAIDIAIDLTGYTRGSRTGIFAYRAAPIQINYLGFPGTMGADFMDYMVVDNVVVPDEQREHYSEKLIRLPHAYMATDNAREIPGAAPSRAEAGLPELGFVFCAFNNSYKITPREFDIWMRLMSQVEGSVLWLRGGDKTAEENLRREAQSRGVDSSRLFFAERVSASEHLARHQLADLFLDTFIFNAHSTAIDALWAGLPVVTKLGEGFAARVAGSLLTSLGMPELVVTTESEYEALALDLATNSDRLGKVKRRLSENVLSQPLFDSEQFTKHLESGYRLAYQRYFDGQNPADIQVESIPNKNPSKKQLEKLLHFFNRGKFQETLQFSDELLRQYQNSDVLHNIRGAAYSEMNQVNESIDSFQRALNSSPDNADALNNMGKVLRIKGALDLALHQLQKAVEIRPGFAKAYNNIGNIHEEKRDFDKAIVNYKKALEINPNYVNAHNNLGVSLMNKRDLTSALVCFEHALELNPDYAEARYNKGIALLEKGDLDGADDSYRQAVRIKPSYSEAQAQSLHLQARLLVWDLFYKEHHLVPLLGVVGEKVEPFTILSLEDSPSRHRLRAEHFAKERFRCQTLPFDPRLGKKHRRLRVGYFSVDFQDHPVAHLLIRVLELHNRDDFEIFAYSYGPASEENESNQMRTRIVSAVDHFRDIHALRDLDVAKIAREDAIDIAIDLTGYTKDSRTGIFAYRAAPIQINYLGFPGTMGADFMDYMVVDNVVVPDEQREHYSEKLIRLPHAYMATDNTREIPGAAPSRAEAGLPEQVFVFCVFNNSYKITPREFDIWMRLLLGVEGSVLWLRRCHKTAEENLRREAQSRGVDSSRLIFAERVSASEHLARHQLADLFLDTFIFNAHSTAIDALWAGLPVVTKLGEGFAARVAGSLLTSLGMPELVVTTESEYEALALDLATNSDRLGKVKRRLSENVLSQPLFDSEQFTKHLECGYRQAYERYLGGQDPADIQVF